MARTIEWTQTGGNTHRVTITSDEPAPSLWQIAMNSMPGDIGVQNFVPSEAYLAAQANAMQNAPMPVLGDGGSLGGIFGSLL